MPDDPDSGFADIDPEAVPEGNGMPDELPGEAGAELDDVDKAGAVYDAALDFTNDAEIWRTARNGKKYQIDTESGEITKGNLGQKSWDSPAEQNARRDKVEDAMREIANGKTEATVPGLRNDLAQYGGTNDVTIIRGDEKKGLIHIKERHGMASIAPVLEAVANGKITRCSRGNKTVAIQKDGYEAILSLEEHGKQKTWLLTGYGILDDRKKVPTGDSGKVCTRHASTHTGPTSSRPGMGAVSSFSQKIGQLLEKSNLGSADTGKEGQA